MHLLKKFFHNPAFVPLCLAAAVAVRVGWILIVNPQPVSDMHWYYDHAVDIAQGRGYTLRPGGFWPENIPPPTLIPSTAYPDSGLPTAYWPVGYPAFLAAIFAVTGPSVRAGQVANLVLGLGAVGLAYAIARRLFGDETVARLTLLILVFYPNHIVYTTLLASEPLFLFLLLAGIALLLPPRSLGWNLAAGVVFGLACLVKPQAILVPLIVLVSQKQFRAILPVYLILAVTLAPWLARNYGVFDQSVFISTNGGYNMLVGHNAHADGGYVFNRAITVILAPARAEPARDRLAARLAAAHIAANPVETIQRWPLKLWHLYARDTDGLYWNEQGLGGSISLFWLKIPAQLYYLAILAGFVAFLLGPARRCSAQTRLGVWLVLYFSAVTLLTFGYSRFHHPLMPWLAMYAAAAGQAVRERRRLVPYK
jgi:4-amino-4-deoxy-L-arabinose transferase-like glycosyltransferase